MFWDCLSVFYNFIIGILSLPIPGLDITFLQLAVALAFLPICINVFSRIFGGTIGVDSALKTAQQIDKSNSGGDDDD